MPDLTPEITPLDAPPLPSLPDFDIRRCLARGGMAEIHLVRVLSGGLRDTDVVLKRLHPLHAHDPAYVALFVAEARLGEKLVHPHIVQTYELIQRGDELFILQEYVEGCSLAEVLKAGASREGLLTACDDLLSALEYLHAGGAAPGGPPIIHRDVSPENLVIRADGVGKLIDLGLAEVEGHPDHARTGALAGTPAYMSPEQARGEVIDRRSDVFSAGIVIWEVLAGRPLFRRATEFETLRAVCEETPPPLPVPESVRHVFEPVVRTALAANRAKRFASAAELRRALREAAGRMDAGRNSLTAAVARCRSAGRVAG
jgi:serine/threonine-protein kinase